MAANKYVPSIKSMFQRTGDFLEEPNDIEPSEEKQLAYDITGFYLIIT